MPAPYTDEQLSKIAQDACKPMGPISKKEILKELRKLSDELMHRIVNESP